MHLSKTCPEDTSPVLNLEQECTNWVSPWTRVLPWEISRRARYEKMAINPLQQCWCQKRRSKAVGAHPIKGEQRDKDQTSTDLVPHCLCRGQRTRSNPLVKLNQTAKQTLDCISENTTQADNCQQGLWWTHMMFIHSQDSMHAYISMLAHHVDMYTRKQWSMLGRRSDKGQTGPTCALLTLGLFHTLLFLRNASIVCLEFLKSRNIFTFGMVKGTNTELSRNSPHFGVGREKLAYRDIDMPIAQTVANAMCTKVKIRLHLTDPREIIARATPTTQKILTKLAVRDGADWPRAWLRMRTRLDVSAEAGHACPATGFGRRYLPVGVEKKESAAGPGCSVETVDNSRPPFFCILSAMLSSYADY